MLHALALNFLAAVRYSTSESCEILYYFCSEGVFSVVRTINLIS